MVILTEWSELRTLDLTCMANKLEVARIANLRNVYSEEKSK